MTPGTPARTPPRTRPPGASTVLVHDDGSWDSRPAVRAAAREAAGLGLPLVVLVVPSPPEGAEQSESDEARNSDARCAATAVADATQTVPGLPVDSLVTTLGSAELRELLAHTVLLVVGRYSRGGRRALSPGSVSGDLAALTTAPVLVVGREPGDRRARDQKVVVGLGGGHDDERVAQLAIAAARRRGWSLTAVRAVPGPVAVERRSERLLEARRAASQVCVDAAGGAPVDVRVEAVSHEPFGAVRWHCGPRDLAVVGRRSGPSAGGSDALAERLLSAGCCDVLVVPLGSERGPEGGPERSPVVAVGTNDPGRRDRPGRRSGW